MSESEISIIGNNENCRLKLIFIAEETLHFNNEPILKFSSKKLEELAKLKAEGYLPKKAVVSFLVCWYDQENKKESLIALPEIFFESNYH